MSAWLFLGCAILLEVAGTSAMKLSDGFTQFWPSLMIFTCYGLAFTALTLALRGIELSTAYAIWSGAGTALIALISIALFQETMTWSKAISLMFVIIGVAGLNLSEHSP